MRLHLSVLDYLLQVPSICFLNRGFNDYSIYLAFINMIHSRFLRLTIVLTLQKSYASP